MVKRSSAGTAFWLLSTVLAGCKVQASDYILVREITTGDLIQAAALLVAALGLVLTALETRRSARQRRVQQIVDLQSKFYGDPDLMEAYYSIEYDRFVYDESFHGSELEKKVDRLLVHFENIGGLFQEGVVSLRELDFVSYNYLMIYQNEQVKRYLEWLDQWYLERGMKEVPFCSFREVGASLEKRKYQRRTAQHSRSSGLLRRH